MVEQAGMAEDKQFIRGVNLGGWLLVEKWITPTLFAGSKAEDEYSLSSELGFETAEALLDFHRQHFITAEDFRWIADHGLNAVRLPIGYWIFGRKDKPYVGGLNYLDQAFDWAEQFRLKILLDLHGAPGSQNGHDHSGRRGDINWPDPANQRRTLEVLEKLADRYKHRPGLWGIELVNEPSWRVGHKNLRSFYESGYAVLSQHLGADTAIVMSDAFRPEKWRRVMRGDGYFNKVLDVHLYQVFSHKDKRRDLAGHLEVTLGRRKLLEAVQGDWPIIIGEWSAALDPATFEGMSPQQILAARRMFVDAQLLVYSSTRGWFYWTYKTEQPGAWSYRHGVVEGWLPPSFR